MAHPAQQRYISSVKQNFPRYFTNQDVLDIGSLDINGNNRMHFTDCTYTGVDIAPGRNVDIVSKGHEFTSDKQYDVVISTECFEHDQYYALTVKNCVNLLKSGGLFIFTCATIGRPEHGTRKSNSVWCSPLTSSHPDWEDDYYMNLTSEDIRKAIPVDSLFSEYEFTSNATDFDLYFYGIKK